MCQGNQRHHEIYQRIAELCTCGTLRAPWLQLNVDDDCRHLPQDVSEMLPQLRQGFSEQDLLTAGVARRGEGGELLLAEMLANPTAEVILLRERPCSPPFDIVASNGLLSGRELPMFAACRDHRTRVALQGLDGVLLIVFSMSTYVLLRSMGLPVALAAGLDDLDHERLSSLEQMLCRSNIPGTGMEQPAEFSENAAQGDESTTAGRQSAQVDTDPIQASSLLCSGATEIESQFCTDGTRESETQAAEKTVLPRAVILVAWEPATLEIQLPPGVAPIVRFLANAEQHLGIDFSTFGVWCPSENDVEALQFCIRHGNDEQIRAAVLQSIEQSSLTLSYVIGRYLSPRPVAENYATAQAELRRCLDTRVAEVGRDEQLARAIAQHESLVERDLVHPLVDQATAIANPLLRNLGVTAANVFRTIHRRAPYVDLCQVDGNASHRDPSEAQVNLINAVVKLVREIRRE